MSLYFNSLKFLQKSFHRWKDRVYVDHRSWKQRRDAFVKAWEPLMDSLADFYLHWHANSPALGSTTPEMPPDALPVYEFSIQVIDIYTLTRSAMIPRASDSQSPAHDLMKAGYIGSSPQNPGFAVSLTTLELFRVIRLHRASFSIEAFAKTICHFYRVSY